MALPHTFTGECSPGQVSAVVPQRTLSSSLFPCENSSKFLFLQIKIIYQTRRAISISNKEEKKEKSHTPKSETPG